MNTDGTGTNALVELLGGAVTELEILDPGWLFAGRATNLDDGKSWRYVYRSTALKTSSPKHLQMLEWLGDADPIGSAKIATDPAMMFGTGELTLWES